MQETKHQGHKIPLQDKLPEVLPSEDSESKSQIGATLGKRAPLGQKSKKASRRTFLSADEQKVLDEAESMRQRLELIDHEAFFHHNQTEEGDSDEERIFRVERIGHDDYVICGEDKSILYRMREGVQPVLLPHPKEQLMNFKIYKDITWILVIKKLAPTAPLGLLIMDMSNEEKFSRFAMEELLTSSTVLIHQNYLLAIKQQGLFAYNMDEISELIKQNNIRSYAPKLICVLKNAKDFCIEKGCLFVVCDRSNLLHRVELGNLSTVGDAVSKLPIKSNSLILDEFVNENYITNPKVKSLDGDIVICTTNKLVLSSHAGVSQDQYSSTQMIDLTVFSHNQDKFVFALHRREDITILRIYNGGFFVISRLFCLEEDRTLFNGILHLQNLEFLVYNENGYCKRFELKFKAL